MRKPFAILIALAAALAVLPAAEPPKPVIALPLNEGDLAKVRDVSASALPVKSFHAEQFQWQEGPGGQALFFANPDDAKTYAMLNLPLPPGFDPAKGFTLAVRVKTPEKLHRSRQYEILNLADGGKGPGFRLMISWKMVWFYFGDGGKVVSCRTDTAKQPIQPDTWYRISATFDGKTARLYLDGQLAQELTDVKFVPAQRKDLRIGASSSSGSCYSFQGVLGNVLIFNRALTPEEIGILGQTE